MNIDKNASIIDVRTPEEFAGRHYPGAINIPLDALPQRIGELKGLPKPIVVYCQSGGRSAVAASVLKQTGVSDVMNGGGIDDLFQAKTTSYA